MTDIADNVRAFLEETGFATIATTNSDGYPGPQAGPSVAVNIAKTPHTSLVLRVERIKTFGKI